MYANENRTEADDYSTNRKVQTEKLNDELMANGTDSKYQIITNGLYYHYIQKWINVFGTSNILTLSTESLIKNPHLELTKFESFFDLEKYYKPEMFQKQFNGSYYCIEKKSAAKWYEAEMVSPFRLIRFSTDYNPITKNETKLSCLGSNKDRTRSSSKNPEVFGWISQLKKFYEPFNKLLFDLTGTVV